MTSSQSRSQSVLELHLAGILDASLDAEDMARLEQARKIAAEELEHMVTAPKHGPLSRGWDNVTVLAWAVGYLSDVIVGMKGTRPSARSEKALTTWAEVEKAKADAYEDAARLVEKLAEDYTHEHGSYDGSTNAWELGHRHMEKIEGWDDAVEAIRKRKAEKCQVTQVKEVSNG